MELLLPLALWVLAIVLVGRERLESSPVVAHEKEHGLMSCGDLQ